MDDSYRISSSARAADPLVQALRHSGSNHVTANGQNFVERGGF